MVASVFLPENDQAALDELLRPDALPDGVEPERRVVFCGISWDRFLAIDQKLADERTLPQLYYLDGELEIMTTSNEHERCKKWLGDLITNPCEPAVFFPFWI